MITLALPVIITYVLEILPGIVTLVLADGVVVTIPHCASMLPHCPSCSLMVSFGP